MLSHALKACGRHNSSVASPPRQPSRGGGFTCGDGGAAGSRREDDHAAPAIQANRGGALHAAGERGNEEGRVKADGLAGPHRALGGAAPGRAVDRMSVRAGPGAGVAMALRPVGRPGAVRAAPVSGPAGARLGPGPGEIIDAALDRRARRRRPAGEGGFAGAGGEQGEGDENVHAFQISTGLIGA